MSQKPTLLKQVLGAVGGATLALVLYSVYEFATPLRAELTIIPEIVTPTPVLHEAADGLEEDYFDTVTDRALDIINDGSSSSSSSEEVMEVVPEEEEPFNPLEGDVTASTAEDLPDSGIGVMAASLVAFAGSTALYLRRKKQVHA